MNNPSATTVKKRNYFVSYLKGYAIIGVFLVHLIEWSNIVITDNLFHFKEFFYPAVFLFISLSGSVIYLAYGHYENLARPVRRLLIRGAQLIGVYFLYNIIKLFIYNFDKEPFYQQFIDRGIFNTANVITLKTFSVPISIIFTIGILLLIAPVLLWIVKKFNRAHFILLAVIFGLIILNYSIPHPDIWIFNWLYSQNIVIFPVLTWLLPFVMGFYLAYIGFEKKKLKSGLFFLALTLFCTFVFQPTNFWLIPHHDYMYPLQLYYIAFGFTFMYLLIYLFTALEKIKHKIIQYPLAALRFLGDKTLSLYIYQWIVIDLTMWVLFPHTKYIWLTIPLFLIAYCWLKRKELLIYCQEQITQKNS